MFLLQMEYHSPFQAVSKPILVKQRNVAFLKVGNRVVDITRSPRFVRFVIQDIQNREIVF